MWCRGHSHLYTDRLLFVAAHVPCGRQASVFLRLKSLHCDGSSASPVASGHGQYSPTRLPGQLTHVPC